MASEGTLPEPRDCSSARPAEGPWTRLQAAFAFAFTKVEEGQEAPDVPQGLTEWAQNTSLTSVIGCAYGGWSQRRRLQQGMC
ncbi:hypothetical protein WJX84_010871 [Apatococcus fuscideae]|uniref:Uncharacterized protein n=1 Tax=Apatococcus fuscideae TaxID=2026836 RepID=A0AAW1TBL6_9CHLO